MEQRTLGTLTVSAIGLGCMGMSGNYSQRPDRDEMIALTRAAFERGVTFFDTAEAYGLGHNEALVGEALRDVRDEVVIATKFFESIDHEKHALNGRRVRPDEVKDTCQGSLERLGTDVIDLYYLHRMNPDVPVEEYAGVLGELIDEGTIRAYGLSEPSEATLRRAHAVRPVGALQNEYNLWWRRPEEGILDACGELGIGFVPFSPLGKGVLTGTVDTSTTFEQGNDIRATIPRFQGEAFEHNLTLVDAVRQISARLGCTPGQVALAWLLARAPFIVPIPGSTKLHRVEENIKAADVHLSEEDMTRLTGLAEEVGIVGGRYEDAQEARTNL